MAAGRSPKAKRPTPAIAAGVGRFFIVAGFIPGYRLLRNRSHSPAASTVVAAIATR
jgi:hypothetical protein